MDKVLAKGASNPEDPFDTKNKIASSERILCLDETTGKVLWKVEYDCPYQISYPGGPRCTPLVSGGKVYTLGAMGNLYCLDAKTGKELWKVDFKEAYKAKPAIWGFAAHPILDGRHVAVRDHLEADQQLDPARPEPHYPHHRLGAARDPIVLGANGQKRAARPLEVDAVGDQRAHLAARRRRRERVVDHPRVDQLGVGHDEQVAVEERDPRRAHADLEHFALLARISSMRKRHRDHCAL